MKKVISVVMVALFLISCSNNFTKNTKVESVVLAKDSTGSDEANKDGAYNKVLEESESIEYNTIEYNEKYKIKGDTPDEFSSLIYENPIDLEYEKRCSNYDGSSLMTMEIEADYKNWWNAEMEKAYSELEKLLEGEDLEQLKLSQEAFLEYLNSKENLDTSFYFEQKYGAIGNLRSSSVYYEKSELVKNRAYTLLEYLYILTGEINFVFDLG